MNVNLNRPGIGKKLKVRFFVHNLRNILLLCLIPLLLLGSLSISISQRYTRLDAEQSQEKMLNQYNELIQVVASEMDSLSLSFNTDPKISNRLSNILSKPEYSYEDVEALFYLNNIIAVPANSKPYIHSVYVYYDNPQQRFLSSREGLVSLKTFRDQAWYESYVGKTDISGISTEVRSLQEYAFQTNPTKVVSLYKFLTDRTTNNKEGVIVVNMLPDYFVKSYQSLSEQPDRSFYITDARNQIIMQSGMSGRDGLLTALTLPKQFDVLHLDRGIYHLTVKKTDRLNWNLISIVPRKSLYNLPYTLIVTTCLLSLLSLAVCALAALWLTGKNYRQVYGIIRILEAADAPDSIEGERSSKVHDIYELIITNILESFVAHKYVKVQLSERLYRMQALEFKALQSQINPHFLYNTLNSIYWKTFQLTNSRNAPSHMIELLSELLQYALDTSAKVVSLREEMTHIRSYVDIQQIRYKDRFTVIWDELDPYADCEVLKLSLQPLIENSIQYGMESNPHLLVKVKFRLQGSMLKVTVIDNGGGMDKERLAATRAALASDAEPQRHIGLSNTNKRIMLQYGEACRSKVLSRKGLGTAVTLHFPQ